MNQLCSQIVILSCYILKIGINVMRFIMIKTKILHIKAQTLMSHLVTIWFLKINFILSQFIMDYNFLN